MVLFFQFYWDKIDISVNIMMQHWVTLLLLFFCVCGGFCHTLTWIHHGCTCVPQPDPPSHLPPHPIPQGHPSAAAAAAAKSLQSCLTLCDPIDGSPPGSPVPGILQARTLEWVTISFSSAWKWKVKVKSLSLVRLLATPWTAAHQAPPSMGFSRQECWSGVPYQPWTPCLMHQTWTGDLFHIW